MLLQNFDKSTPDGRRNLLTALSEQVLMRGLDAADIEPLIDLVEVEEHGAGDSVVEQSQTGNDVFLIITGGTEIKIDHRHIGFRKPGDHVGEMAAIDPAATRSACVIAQANTVTARLSASSLFALADAHPRVWLNLTKVLAARLRARPVPPRNERPQIFIGSSSEGLPEADGLFARLSLYPEFVTRPWTVGVFRASNFPLDDLLRVAQGSDFAVMMFGPDDTTTSRRKRQKSPRDNVVLEYGLYVGALGSRERVFIVTPQGAPIKLPSDINGLTRLTYDPTKPLDTELARVAMEIRDIVNRLGPR